MFTYSYQESQNYQEELQKQAAAERQVREIKKVQTGRLSLLTVLAGFFL